MGKTARLLKSAYRHISVFISHSAANNYEEARRYEEVLRDGGFSVFQCGEDPRPNDPVGSVVREKISKCHFFMLVVSEPSLNSPRVQRELGLALSLQKAHDDYRPIIIPLYAKEASWRATGERPKQFPMRDFDTGKTLGQFDLTVRGWDKYSNPLADSAENLISFLKPNFIVSRLDFDDAATFYDTGVFKLYEELFPPVERDDEQDILRWVLMDDVGQKRKFVISQGNEISFALDSRYFILKVAGRAIGLSFFTYDHASHLIYGNYIGVQECWRGGGMARAFFLESMKILEALFPRNQGLVFELERFNQQRVGQIIADLEESRSDQTGDPNDLNEIRKFLRVTWYHSLNCSFFFNKAAEEPLLSRSPCIKPSLPRSEWSKEEEDYWIMYRPINSRASSYNAKELWAKAVKSIYIEILAKSLCESFPKYAQQYWNYANAITDRTLSDPEALGEICFSKFLDHHSSPLLARWMALGIDVKI